MDRSLRSDPVRRSFPGRLISRLFIIMADQIWQSGRPWATNLASSYTMAKMSNEEAMWADAVKSLCPDLAPAIMTPPSPMLEEEDEDDYMPPIGAIKRKNGGYVMRTLSCENKDGKKVPKVECVCGSTVLSKNHAHHWRYDCHHNKYNRNSTGAEVSYNAFWGILSTF